VAGPGSQVDGEQERGDGAWRAVDGEVLVAESAVHAADMWGGTAPGMVSCSLTFGTSAVVCRHEPNRYHPCVAARKMSPGCVCLLHTAHCAGRCSEPHDTVLCRGAALTAHTHTRSALARMVTGPQTATGWGQFRMRVR
jgi:hypothetical protein